MKAILASRRIGGGLYERYDRGVSTKLRRGLVGNAVAVCLLLAGCGHSVTVRGGGTLRVALTEYRLVPSSIHLHAGALTIEATNVGRLTHNLVVSRRGTTVAAIRPLSPGQSAQVTVTLPPGTYLVGSTLLSDEALGLYGHIDVSG
jgi:hypothetical protein